MCCKGRHSSGDCHAKRHWSSEPSRELKDPEYADKDKMPGVCICSVRGCEKVECKYRLGEKGLSVCVCESVCAHIKIQHTVM